MLELDLQSFCGDVWIGLEGEEVGECDGWRSLFLLCKLFMLGERVR